MSNKEKVMNEHQEIHVVVSYLGHDPWKHPFRPTDTVHTVKVEAMTKGFGLEETAADKYVLQANGTDVPETTALDQFGKNPVEFQLVLKEEPNKG